MNNRYPWLDEFLSGRLGAVKDFKAEWGWMRYQVGGKMFAAICTPEEEHKAYSGHTLINLKCDPLMADLLKEQYADIRPAFYMDKRHWISIYLDGDVPDDLLRMLSAESHRLVFETLKKKMQKELTAAQKTE